MGTTDYTCTFTVPEAPEKVYAAILQVSAWWTVHTDGPTREVGDTFTVQFGDVHRTVQRITAAIPAHRVVWQVVESRLPWLHDTEEWRGTEIVFALEPADGGTRLTFTHHGLTPQRECYAQCEQGWDYFIRTSLQELVRTGTGRPDTTERTHMDTIGHVHPKNA